MAATAVGELVGYLDELLDAAAGPDFCPNGLQVEGRRPVTKLVTGVSACQELFERARERGADAVLVHHGLFWDGAPRQLTGVQYRRLRELVESGMALIAYHLPLDRHPALGNNAVAAERLGLSDQEPFGDYGGAPLGVRGRFAEPVAVAELIERCAAVFEQRPLAFPSGPDPVRTLAIVSGAAEKELHRAIAEGLDAFLTGESSEWVMNVARESAITFLGAGHYATERLGVQALGEHLAERFGLEVEFVDVPNPV